MISNRGSPAHIHTRLSSYLHRALARDVLEGGSVRRGHGHDCDDGCARWRRGCLCGVA